MRRALTLVELLVVIAILVILMAIMIPMLNVTGRGRNVREGARQFAVFLRQAQAKALQSGRPTGVWIERERENNNAGWKIWLCQVPPPYCGDTMDARAEIIYSPGGVASAGFSMATASRMQPPFVQPGDRIQFNFKGPLYELYAIPWNRKPPMIVQGSRLYWRIQYMPGPAQALAQLPPPSKEGVPFQVFRRPQKLVYPSLTLPENTSIDLAWSGTDTGDDSQKGRITKFGYYGPPGDSSTAISLPPIVLLFDEKGQLRFPSLYPEGMFHVWAQLTGEVVLDARQSYGDMFFLIGKFDQAHLGNAERPSNIEDGDAMWVVVTTDGQILTAHNAGLPEGVEPDDAQSDALAPAYLNYARQLARDKVNASG